MAKSTAATTLNYTEKDLAAIKILDSQEGPASLKDLGFASATIVSLMAKAKKFPEDARQIIAEDVVEECPNCGSKRKYKLYQIVK